ncbi:MAG: hypothetical protein ACR2P0_15935 [Acidimicrobiales bacterium]
MKESTERRLRTRLIGVAVVLAAIATLVFVAPAGASHGDGELPMFVEHVRTRGDGTDVYRAPLAKVFDNTTGESLEYVVIWSGDLYDVCGVRDPSGPPPPAKKMLAKERPNARWTVKTPPGGHVGYTSVYSTDMAVFDFFDASCGAFFGEGRPLPAPYATGMTTLRDKATRLVDPIVYLDGSTPLPRGKYLNSVIGEVADANGALYDLEAVADYVVRDPNPEVTPDFDELTVTLTPKAG